ncbi:type I restriction-modification enzyme R subunit C-terminal domain-containing protein [Vibrio cortegadensis]|uniref:type I restriction-modification enzyme R subunit C-terminal domain-containing protein n=1 Tax=Vibrio cortegadensis TaxID=1328770 RepID=UPI00352E4D53
MTDSKQKILHAKLAQIQKPERRKLQEISSYQGILNEEDFSFTVFGEQAYSEMLNAEGFLSSFEKFINDNACSNSVLSTILNTPKELTRAQLKEIRILLDGENFKEANLQAAWKQTTNRDIAASIVGHIRTAALGEALMPYERRIDMAMDSIYAMHSWTKPQLKWLDRIAKQLKKEIVLQTDDINRSFAQYGGCKGLDKRLNGQLEQVLAALNEHIWQQQG